MSPQQHTDGGPRPRVFARLAHEATRREQVLRVPRNSRWIGWVVVAATMLVVAYTAARVSPWG